MKNFTNKIIDNFSLNKNLYYREPVTRGELAIVATLIFIRFIFLLILLNQGFLALAGDDFGRQIAGYSWFKNPFFLGSAWPPLQFWTLGIILKIYPHIREANLFINISFSTLAMVFFYLFLRLFFKKKIALVSLAFAVTFPWQLKLSLSGLAEPLYYFFLFTSLYYFFSWEAHEKNYALIVCAVSTLGACMLRMDAWVFYVAFSCYIMAFLFTKKQFKKNELAFLIPLLSPFLFICLWIVLGKMEANYSVLREEFIVRTAELSSTYIRLIRYPSYLFLLSPIIAAAGIAGLIPFFKHNKKLFSHYVFIPLLYFLGMLMVSVITGADSLTAPLRFSMPFLLFLIPVSLVLFYNFNKNQFRRTAYIYMIAVLAWNLFFTWNFNRNAFAHIASVSKSISALWSSAVLHEKQKVFFERNPMKPFFYDHLALRVLTNRPDDFILYHKSKPDYTLNQVESDLRSGDLGALITSSRMLKENFSKKYSDSNSSSVGPYTIFLPKNVPIPLSTDNTPEHILNLTYRAGIVLRGYRVDKGKFPFGISTYWEFDHGNQLPITIQYTLIPGAGLGKAITLNAHNLGDIPQSITRNTKVQVVDWQELILPKTAQPGRYTIALMLDGNGDPGGNPPVNPDEMWTPVTEINLITNKRDVLNRMLQRKLQDYRVGLQVLTSLF